MGKCLHAVALCLLTVGGPSAFAQEKTGTRSLYLMGDAGAAGEDHSAPVMRLLEEVTAKDTAVQHALVFLGDNLYPEGLHKKNDPVRKRDEANLAPQIEAAERFPGHTVFIPGNHDWQQGGRKGRAFVERQEKYIQDTLGKGAFQPDHGCPGPDHMDLGNNTVLVFLDTQWWLQLNKRPEGPRDGCDVATEKEFLLLLEDLLKHNKGKRIIIAAHHPVYSYGEHGGYFPFKDHLFPLTALNKHLWLPLPVIGSIYPGYRKLIGNVQDLANARYTRLRKGVEKLLKEYPGTVYAAGHEHNLEYLRRDGIHYVVSGAGSKTAFLQAPNPLSFGASERGFARIDIAADGSLSLSFFTLSGGAKPVYSMPIEAPPAHALRQADDRPMLDLRDSVTVVPNAELAAGKFKRFFLGNLYRDLWAAPIKVPVLHMDTTFGGLTAKSIGGGMQTRSVKLKAGNGHEYVLRLVRKYPGMALDPQLRSSVVEDVVVDGIAANHPYASVMVGPIADAVQVLHTDPRLVFVGDDPGLDIYRDAFANTLGLLEERTSGDWSHTPSLGNSKDLVSSTDLIDALRKSHDAVLDHRAVLRARLLDLEIGDWDRHDDQWRWATYDLPHGKTLYKPVPRDRDEAFFRQDGILPNIFNRKWLMPKFQTYGPDIRDMAGQNFNARYFDRAYLTGLSWPAWKSIADSMRTELTDSVFSKAIIQLPDTAQRGMGAFAMAGLKGRRDGLEKLARRMYLQLARNVNVVGTYEGERFVVKRMADGSTEVEMWDKRKKHDDERVYHRVFLPSETKEIRLYGIAGKDDFEISGDVRRAIKLRIIEGEDRSKVKDDSQVRSCAKRTIIYGSGGKKANKKRHLGTEARLVKSSGRNEVEYVRDEYVPDLLMPVAAVGYNKDDGVFLGGGFTWTKHGFKAEPFKWQHHFTASTALKTGAYHLDYRGKVNNVLGKTGFGLDAEVLAPDYRFNYFGMGNRTTQPPSDSQFQFRLDLVDIMPYAERTFGDIQHLKIGGHYFSSSQGVLSKELPGSERLPDVDDMKYLGGFLEYSVVNVDNVKEPRRGVRLELRAEALGNLGLGTDVRGLNADLRTYSPVDIGRYRGVLAIRMAVVRRSNDIDPLTAATLGGQEAMRGLRRDRFSGNLAAYGNLEVRSDLLSSHNGFLPFRLGLIALADAGRVWVFGTHNSPMWHHAFGGGFFLSPLDMVVLQATYAVSDDDDLLDVRLGFFF